MITEQTNKLNDFMSEWSLSRTDAAELLGVSARTIYNNESGVLSKTIIDKINEVESRLKMARVNELTLEIAQRTKEIELLTIGGSIT